MASKREVVVPSGSVVELTSLRTRRKVSGVIGEVVGTGGLAKVYDCLLDDGNRVAIKTQRFEGRGADHALEVEIELFKKLFHRNIVHCVGVGVTGNGHLAIGFRRAYQNPLLLMSKANVDEGMRRDKKAKYPTLPLDTSIDLSYEILNSLAYLERLGFVHHDVKLANVLIDVAPREREYSGSEIFGQVVKRAYRGVLIDFGATRSRNYLEAWNRGETLEGLAPQITPFYAPPESVVESRRENGELGLVFHPSLDVYAAALVIYAMVTGHPPYSHLRAGVNPHDLESVISVKSAERRGEIDAISDDIIRRVVFEDTKFVDGNRAAFDLALYRFLQKRLDPDPDSRGTASEMKRDFERLCKIRSSRGQGAEMLTAGASRVFLPFQQELVKVASGGDHPLLRAARLFGVDFEASEAEEDPTEPQKGPSAEAVADSGATKDGGMEWLDDMMIDDAPKRPPSSSAPPRRRTPPPEKKERRPGSSSERSRPSSSSERNRPGSSSERNRPGSSSERNRPGSSAEGNRPSPTGGSKRPSSTSGSKRLPKKSRPPSGRSTAANSRAALLRNSALDPDSGRVQINKASTRSFRPDEPVTKNPAERGAPSSEIALAPHCLLSPVLDAPLLLSRERRYFVGRDPSVDVRIKSDLVSRRHAQIHFDGNGFMLTDLGSLNGTSLNEFRLQAPCVLHDEDRISFGGFEFVVRVLHGGDWNVDEEGGTTRIFKGEEDITAGATPIFSGNLSQLALKDVIELINWKQHSGTLAIQPEDEPQGYLYFTQGKLIHGSTKDVEGVGACTRMLLTRKGTFSFKHGKPRCPETITESIDELWQLSKRQS